MAENQTEEDPLAGEPEQEGKPGSRFVPDFVRRMAWAGLGAVFMSEEGVRRLAGQLKLPKEALGFLLAQAEKTKDDVGRVVSEEVRKLLQSDKLRDEMLKLIAGMTIEVRAEVKLVPDRVKGKAPSLLPKIAVHDLKTTYSSEEPTPPKRGKAKRDDPPDDE
jgi:hypothetical protein